MKIFHTTSAALASRALMSVLGTGIIALTFSANAMTPLGSPLNKISVLGGLNTWEALDERRVVVSTSPKKTYLLTLSHSCHSLPFANHLGVSTSNNTVYAGFDYITADGQRCAIKTINRLSKQQKRALLKL